jgi:ferritin-like metal-binding protein YciE
MEERMDILQNYVSDMLAVEQHIHQAVRQQEKDGSTQRYPLAASLISRAEALLDDHIAALESHLEQIGGDPKAPVKEAVTAVLGVGAGIIDKLRTKQVSKMLRDDYTAFSLAAISYHMLHTTALGLHSQSTADLAERHLMNWTPIITEISHMIHEVVAQELQDEGHPVDTSMAMQSAQTMHQAWQQESLSY